MDKQWIIIILLGVLVIVRVAEFFVRAYVYTEVAELAQYIKERLENVKFPSFF